MDLVLSNRSGFEVRTQKPTCRAELVSDGSNSHELRTKGCTCPLPQPLPLIHRFLLRNPVFVFPGYLLRAIPYALRLHLDSFQVSSSCPCLRKGPTALWIGLGLQSSILLAQQPNFFDDDGFRISQKNEPSSDQRIPFKKDFNPGTARFPGTSIAFLL